MYFLSTIIVSVLVATSEACSGLYARDVVPEWGYNPDDGAMMWYNMDPVNNTLCGRGTHQSPINLNDDSARVDESSGYVLNYPTLANVPFYKTHHTIQAQVSEVNATNSLQFGGNTYTLKQFHFHAPSEHRIDDEYFPLEAHFVHATKNGSIAVIGFPIEVGCDNDPLLASVLSHADETKAVDSTPFKLPSLDFSSLVEHFQANQVFRYSGSLSTPPCTEGFEWIVSAVPLVVDVFHFNKAKRVLGFNARYTQSDPGLKNVLEAATASP